MTAVQEVEEKEEERTVRNDKDVVLKSGIFGSKRITRSERMDGSPCLGVPELTTDEKRVQVSNVSALMAGKMLDYGDTNAIEDTNNGQNQICHALAELQSQLLKTEAALREKEEENAMLKRHLQEYDMWWSNYESKMKSMKETWQRQLNSLQRNPADERKSHGLEEILKRNGRLETSKVNHYYDSEASSEVQSLKGMLSKLRKNSNSVPVRNQDTTYSSVVQLIEEFDQQQEIFDDHTILVVGAKSGKVGANINHFQELQDLKTRFSLWKKDYKMRVMRLKAG
ncbi:myosin-1-like [Zingiber officinale]|uniref:myosin-1-like n=1 Tax=Zingiber officinale TaxID=94328 RepID=UPI001C4C5FC0|nr:myosin-1-like [Zingiber officinale]